MVKTRTNLLKIRKNPENQTRILTELCQNRAYQRELAKKLDIDEGSLSRSIKSLNDKKLIENTSWNDSKSNNEKIWKITNLGIKEILQNSKPKDFWRSLLLIYDSDNENFNNTPEIDSVLKNFEEKNIQVSREDIIPHDYNIIKDQFNAIAHNYPNIIGNHWFVILDIIGCNSPMSFEEIEKILEKDYKKLFNALKGIDKSSYSDWYKPLHKGKELEKAINQLRRHKFIKKIKTDKSRFRLDHYGFLLYSYFLLNNLESNKYGITDESLKKGIEWITKPSRREKLVKSRINIMIKQNSNLFPGIFYNRHRLEINDYYILMILVIINFPIHKDFFDSKVLENYIILKIIQDKVEKKDNKKFQEYYGEMNKAIFELIKKRKTQKSFVSDLSDMFFKKIKKEYLADYKRYKREWEKETEELKKSDNSWKRESAKSHQENMPKWEFTGYEYVKELLDNAKSIIQYNDGIYQDKFDPIWKEILPSPEDTKVINRVLDTILRKYIISDEITKEHARDYWAGQLDDKYINYQKNVENRITFDFYLLYRFLEPEKWEKNFHKNEPIKKWHDEKIKKFWKFNETISKEEQLKINHRYLLD